MTLLYIALGGAIGAVLRYLVGLAVAFPYGTIGVNVIGSFLIGLIYVFATHKGLEKWVPFLVVGVLGGFTTFSTFSLDVLRLVEAGKIMPAGGYILATVFLSIFAVFLAVYIAKGLTS